MSGDASPRPRPRWFPWAAAALGLAAGLALAEGGAFLYYRTVVHRKALPLPREFLEPIEVEDPELFWRFLPDVDGYSIPADPPYPARTISTNSYGLRDEPISVPKPRHVFRILSMGESTTMGDLPNADTYTQRLEGKLRSLVPAGDPLRFEVVNAGHSSYTTHQSRRLLELHGDEWRPDMVLLYHEGNDQLPTGHRHSENSRLGLGYTDRELAARLEAARETPTGWIRERLLRHSWLFWLVHLGAFDRSRVPDADRLDNLEAMLAMTRRWDAELVALHPIFDKSEPHECVLTRFAAEHDVPLVELLDAWRDSGLDADAVFMDGVHPTPEGHEMIAEAILRALLERQLVPVRG